MSLVQEHFLLKTLNFLKSEITLPHSNVPMSGCHGPAQRMLSGSVSEAKALSDLFQGLQNVIANGNKVPNLMYIIFSSMASIPFLSG